MSPTDRDDEQEKEKDGNVEAVGGNPGKCPNLGEMQDATVLIASLPCNLSPGQNLPKYSLSLRFISGNMLGICCPAKVLLISKLS